MFVQFKQSTWKASLLATIISMLAVTVALAAPGDLDTTFDGDGLVTSFAVPTSPGRNDRAYSVAVQANGKIVAAGYNYAASLTTSNFAVIRHNADGSLDTTFSGDGRLTTDFGAEDLAYDIAVQSDGKIVVAGSTCSTAACDVALARYKVGGGLDTAFSGDGKQTSDFGSNDNGSFALTVQPNGKIVVAGYMWNGSNYDFAIYRYLSGGGLDNTFGGDGMVNVGFGAGRQDFANDVVIQSDGKIVVIGYTGDVNYENNNFAIARLNAGGGLDTTFSGDGKLTTNFGADEYAYNVALQTDGKIVVAGEKDTATLFASALARYNTDGTPDTTFNITGRRVFSITSNADSWITGVRIQSDGKIVALGSTANGDLLDFSLVRLNTGGGFDSTFSGDGKVTVDFGGNDFGNALAIQSSDGKYVLGGYTLDSTQRDFALARVLP